MTIREANVTLMVRDMDKAIRFYTETLGLKLKARYGDHFAQIEAPGTIIALHPAVAGTQTAAGQSAIEIGFSVDDLNGMVKELTTKGVEFSRGTEDAQVRLAFFRDPDGNPLYLSQSKWG